MQMRCQMEKRTSSGIVVVYRDNFYAGNRMWTRNHAYAKQFSYDDRAKAVGIARRYRASVGAMDGNRVVFIVA